MKPLSDEFTAFIGIDWADRKHDICLQGAHGERREFACIEDKVDAIDQCRSRCDNDSAAPLALGMTFIPVEESAPAPGNGTKPDRPRTRLRHD